MLLVALMVATSLMSGAAIPAGDLYPKKSLEVSDFNGLEISSVLTVEVEQTSKCYLEVYLPEEVFPYLEYSVSGGVLELYVDWEKAGKKLRKKYFKSADVEDLLIRVGMKDLNSIESSGVTDLRLVNDFKITGDLEVDISGVSSLGGNFHGVGEASIDVNGASAIGATLTGFATIDIDCSGSGKLNLKTQTGFTEMEASGASKVTYEVTGQSCIVRIDASGAAKVDLFGETLTLDVEASGAASVDAKEMAVQTVSVDISGASKFRVKKGADFSTISTSGAASLIMK